MKNRIFVIISAFLTILLSLSTIGCLAESTSLGYYLIDYSEKSNCFSTAVAVDSCTELSYNHSLECMRMTCCSTRNSRTPAIRIGTVKNGVCSYGLPFSVPVKQYPVIAVRLKLSNPDMSFYPNGRIDWTTTSYTASAEATPWRDMKGKTDLVPTDKWQTVYIDTSKLTSVSDTKWLSGNWDGLRILFDYTGVKIGDTADIKWIGFFKSVSDIIETPEKTVGDINSDNVFDILDLVRMKRYFCGTANAYDFNGGDINDDEIIDADDLKFAKLILLGKDYEELMRENSKFADVNAVSFPVSNGMTAQESANSINNKTVGEIKKLDAESVRISEYDGDWAFAHHGFIAQFKGELYAMWSNGRAHEDDLGQRVMYSHSDNFGSWSTPEPLVDSVMGEQSEAVLFPAGFFVDGDTLIAYYRVHEYYYADLENEHTMRPTSGGGWKSVKSYYMASKDGRNWSEPTEITIKNAGSSQAKQNNFGRYIWAGSTGIAYADNTNGATGWSVSELSSSQIDTALNSGASMLCEANCYQTGDNVMHLVMRSNAGVLWDSESYDNGETWSDAYPTQFTDDSTMCYFGRLPDGRYYYVGSPFYSGSNARYPLMLCISDDGYNFGEQYILCDEDYDMKQNGYAKGGVYAYPECCVCGGYVNIIYSLEKEVMQVTRFKISDLDNPNKKYELKTDAPAIFSEFKTDTECASVKAYGDSAVEFDVNSCALKVTPTALENSPASFTVTGFENKNVSVKDYPVIAFKVKCRNYNAFDLGACYFSTTYSAAHSKRWVQFKSPKYNAFTVSGGWTVITVDLSKYNNYYDYLTTPASLQYFSGNWSGLQIGLGKKGIIGLDSEFYIQSAGVFKNFIDAYTYYY